MATEEYELSKSSEGWEVMSSISMIGVLMDQELNANTNGEMVNYRLTINVDGQIQKILINQEDEALDYGIEIGGNQEYGRDISISQYILPD